MFNNKKIMNHADRIMNAQEQAQEALGMFKVAHDKLEVANQELEAVVTEAETEAKKLVEQAERARLEIGMNKSVQQKLIQLVVPADLNK